MSITQKILPFIFSPSEADPTDWEVGYYEFGDSLPCQYCGKNITEDSECFDWRDLPYCSLACALKSYSRSVDKKLKQLYAEDNILHLPTASELGKKLVEENNRMLRCLRGGA